MEQQCFQMHDFLCCEILFYLSFLDSRLKNVLQLKLFFLLHYYNCINHYLRNIRYQYLCKKYHNNGIIRKTKPAF